ncbi:MAG: polyphosphate kinase 2 family protein [Acidobacteria bacterium]|nr:polyphosphate kinase 2 family protein [Acidobacteriota bacterium]
MGVERFGRKPGEPFRLEDFDPDDDGGISGKEEGRRYLKQLQRELDELQEVLYAEGKHALLVVLQAMDCAGKDGTIRHALSSFDPQGVMVTSFKVPTEEERAHDFLWRVHKAVPRKGMVGIFNRSHYEEVLVVRVKGLKPEEQWQTYYDHINAFERLLAESGVTLVKLFLQISPAEQAERLRERQARPDKQWKFNPGDLEDRALWPHYMKAYEDALSRCNTPWAPWYVIPANRKWYRNIAVSEILIETLKGLGMRYPEPVADLQSYEIPPV